MKNYEVMLKKHITKAKKLILQLLRNGTDIKTSLFGKPENLTGNLSGYCSLRINSKHRIVYQIDSFANTLVILFCYGHYDDWLCFRYAPQTNSNHLPLISGI